MTNRKSSYCDSDIESGVGKASCKIFFQSGLLGLVYVFEDEDAVVLLRKIFQCIPLGGLETFQALILFEFFS